MYAYTNLLTPTNTAIGVGEYALVAPLSWFVSPGGIKAPVAPFTNKGDSITITTAHEFISGKAFTKYVLIPDQNQLSGKPQGDKGSQNFGFEADIFVAGSYAEALEQFSNLLNTPCIVLIPDANCNTGLFYQLGCDCSQAYANIEYMTGTTVGGKKGHSLKFQWSGPSLYLYNVDGGPEIFEDDASS